MASLLRLCLAASLFLCVFTVSAHAQIFPPPEGHMETKIDRFTDIRSEMLYQLQVALREPELDHQRLYLTLRADFTSATSSKPPDYVGVVFTSWSLWNNRYRDVTALNAIIDGERMSYDPFMPVERQVINGKYVVVIAGRISYKAFRQITNGKKVEMRLGDFEFTLTEPVMKTLREYADRAQPFIKEP